MSDQTSALLRAFVPASRRDLYLSHLGSLKGRALLRQALRQFRDFDWQYVRPVPPAHHSPVALHALLREHGATGFCYLLSVDEALDGRTMPLVDALRQVMGCGSRTFISCLPGRLAYFEGDTAGERYLLERTDRGDDPGGYEC
ncbi:MAG TPA: hypothetical protein VFW98_04800 [Gemmatimonadaceae bacterium]|nr:hypothetical protein [Gemmatimonadaceae bacterium]